jgi:hemerythrin-like domain-containing protein
MARARREFSAPFRPVTPEEIMAPPLRLLADPIEYICEDHFRQRRVCRALRMLAAGQVIPGAVAEQIAKAMQHDLALHHRDEDEDLFPLLRARAHPEDGLEPLLAQLSQDHARGEAAAKKLAAALSMNTSGERVTLGPPAAKLATQYVRAEQRHLAIENGIVMVMARKRLSPKDINALTHSMKARRGVPT